MTGKEESDIFAILPCVGSISPEKNRSPRTIKGRFRLCGCWNLGVVRHYVGCRFPSLKRQGETPGATRSDDQDGVFVFVGSNYRFAELAVIWVGRKLLKIQ